MAPNKIKLSREHITAVEHNRRVIVNYDTGAEMVDMAAVELEKLISNYFEHIDDAETQIDSVLWCWSEGNDPWWPSKVLDDADIHPYYRKWREKNIDFVRIFLEETKKRGLEAFLAYRINGTDMTAEGLPDKDRLEVVAMPCEWQTFQDNIPPAKSVQDQIELRLNNILLEQLDVENGWLVFTAHSRQFAMGKNLVGVRVTKRPPDVRKEITVEKLEAHVRYR